MPLRMRWSLAAVVTLLICAACLWNGRNTNSGMQLQSTVLAANDSERWYRGNLHTHSLWSDGDDYLESIALWYRDQKYDFLSFTDHNLLQRTERWLDVEKSKGKREAYEKLLAKFPDNWVEERMNDGKLEVKLKTFDQVSQRLGEPGKFLLIQGEEITDRFEKKPIHMNATNAQELIPPLGGSSVYEVMQNNANAVIAQRERTGQPMLVHVNHPNFVWGITAEELARVRGENFFEVYNGHPGVNNKGDAVHASTERIWDIILAKRLTELDLPLMYGIATDDGHNYHKIPSRNSEPGRGWVMVLASELSVGALIDSLEKGRFYSSSGVALNKIVSDETGLSFEIAAEPGVEYTIEFIGTRAGFDPESTPVLDADGNELNVTRQYSEDIGRVFARSTGTSGSYQFTGDELYVRARITSSKLHDNPSAVGDFQQAWVQPALGPKGRKPESAAKP